MFMHALSLFTLLKNQSPKPCLKWLIHTVTYCLYILNFKYLYKYKYIDIIFKYKYKYIHKTDIGLKYKYKYGKIVLKCT